MSNSNLDLIFDRWKVSLISKTKKRDQVPGNFDELFEALLGAGATLEDAQAICPKAIKAHQPTSSTAKFVWNTVRANPKYAGITQNEFIADWNKDIADTATNSMYAFFSIPEAPDDDGQPKVYGDNKISVKEYRLQRTHASQFRPVDLKSLETNNADLLSEEELLDLVRKRTDG